MPYLPAHTVQKLLSRYQKILHLTDWEIAHDPHRPPDEGNQAQILISHERNGAVLSAGEMDNPERIIVHELIHIHLIRLENLITYIVKNCVHDEEARSAMAENIDNQIEIVVNTLARIITELDNG